MTEEMLKQGEKIITGNPDYKRKSRSGKNWINTLFHRTWDLDEEPTMYKRKFDLIPSNCEAKSRSGKSLSKSRQEKMADELACASASPSSRRLLLEAPRCLGRPHALLPMPQPSFDGEGECEAAARRGSCEDPSNLLAVAPLSARIR